MFFPANTPDHVITRYIAAQIAAVKRTNGIDVIIKPHVNQRTIRQNRFLMSVCGHIVQFYHETGFLPNDCKRREMTTTGQKTYWKDVLGVPETHTLSTKEMAEFIDRIQAEMIQQTGGMYEPIIPEDDYLLSFDTMA